jgi:uncharacterized protein (TIGR02217 family)
MGFIGGVHLLPSTGEFTYDTVAYEGARVGASLSPINTFFAPGGAKTDYSYSIDQLQAAHPECTTVSIVCAWFCDGLTPGSNHLYPSTTYIDGAFQPSAGGADEWRCSSLNQLSAGLIPIPQSGGSFIYGGTPSDQSIVRCIRDLKSRGFKVVFYPFILMTSAGEPWRGRMTYSPDVSSAATAAVNAFLGSATTGDFTPDDVNLTVAYSGSPTDYTYRRMILHYAWLITIAGGIDLFVIGSELRGLETIRGPAWTKAGQVDSSGRAVWDYPFVAGLQALANDIRSVLDSQGLTKNLSTLENLIAYSADWSDWMGFQHPGENGQWPHLDQLWATSNIDLVSFDNYLPLSDWTTGEQGLDQLNWLTAAPSGSWPPSTSTMSGLGLTGSPTIYSIPYLQTNIEGGQYFSWYYNDGTNGGPALDPNGSAEIVSQPQGDRAAQARNRYYPNQQILANKQLRWWWNNLHYPVYDDGDGSGFAPHGPQTEWTPNSKPIIFLEYGFPACDKGTNQPNVFYSPASVESFTPFWSAWRGDSVSGYLPVRDDTIALLALQAVYEYWLAGSNNEMVGGVAMLVPTFCCAWNWDARPFPVFPILNSVWGDAGDWAAGNWLDGRGPALPPTAPSPPPSPGTYSTFPTLATLGWSVHIKPKFSTDVVPHVSGREVRRAAYAGVYYDVELTYEVLRSAAAYEEMQAIAGFFGEAAGQGTPFWFAPPGLAAVAGGVLGTGDGETTVFALSRSWGSYSEPVYGTSGLSAVYLNGAAQGSGWSVSSGYGASVTFSTAPAAGIAITADFGVLWLCRFAEDVLDFEEFMAMLFELQVVKLQTVKP